MNAVNDPVKKAFFDAIEGRAVTTKGLVSDHDEAISHAGTQMLWDYIKGAGIEMTVKP